VTAVLRTLLEADRAAAGKRPPPDRHAWHRFICQRCTKHYRVQGISRVCINCVAAAAAVGITETQWIGEASGC
jgi:hypothetical protein